MKLLLAVFVAISIAGGYCDTIPKPSDLQHIKECASENNVDKNMMDDINEEKSFMINPSAMCFVHCVMHRNGMMDEEGKMTDKFLKVPNAADCQNMSGKDKCETAAKGMNCLLNKGSHFETNFK